MAILVVEIDPSGAESGSQKVVQAVKNVTDATDRLAGVFDAVAKKMETFAQQFNSLQNGLNQTINIEKALEASTRAITTAIREQTVALIDSAQATRADAEARRVANQERREAERQQQAFTNTLRQSADATNRATKANQAYGSTFGDIGRSIQQFITPLEKAADVIDDVAKAQERFNQQKETRQQNASFRYADEVEQLKKIKDAQELYLKGLITRRELDEQVVKISAVQKTGNETLAASYAKLKQEVNDYNKVIQQGDKGQKTPVAFPDIKQTSAIDISTAQSLSVLKEKIQVQQQAIAGAKALGDVEEELAVIELRAAGVTEELAREQVQAQGAFAANSKQIREMREALVATLPTLEAVQKARQLSARADAVDETKKLRVEAELYKLVALGAVSLAEAKRTLATASETERLGSEELARELINEREAKEKAEKATREVAAAERNLAQDREKAARQRVQFTQDVDALKREIVIKEEAIRKTISLAEAERQLAIERNRKSGLSASQSEELARIQTHLEGVNRGYSEVGKRKSALVAIGGQLVNTFNSMGHSVRRFVELAAGISAITVAATALRAIFRQIREGINIGDELERNKLAIASLLQGTTQLQDGFGNLIEGTAAWRLNLVEAKELQQEIARISGETLGTNVELQDVFRTALSFSRGQKTDVAEILKLSQAITNVGKLQGLEATRLTDETRQILTLETNRGQTILAQLGISIKQAREYKEQGILVQKLVEALGAYNELAKESANTFEGLRTSIETFSNLFRASVFTPTFEAIKQIMIGARDELDALRKGGGIAQAIGVSDKDLQDLGKTLARLFAIITVNVAALSEALLTVLSGLNGASGGARTFADHLKDVGTAVASARDSILRILKSVADFAQNNPLVLELLGFTVGAIKGGSVAARLTAPLPPNFRLGASAVGAAAGGLLGVSGARQVNATVSSVAPGLGEALKRAEDVKALNKTVAELALTVQIMGKSVAQTSGVLTDYRKTLKQSQEEGLKLTDVNRKVAESLNQIDAKGNLKNLPAISAHFNAIAVAALSAHAPLDLFGQTLKRLTDNPEEQAIDPDKLSQVTEVGKKSLLALEEQYAEVTGNIVKLSKLQAETLRTDLRQKLGDNANTLEGYIAIEDAIREASREKTVQNFDIILKNIERERDVAVQAAEIRQRAAVTTGEINLQNAKAAVLAAEIEFAKIENLVGADKERAAVKERLIAAQEEEGRATIALMEVVRTTNIETLQFEEQKLSKLRQAIELREKELNAIPREQRENNPEATALLLQLEKAKKAYEEQRRIVTDLQNAIRTGEKDIHIERVRNAQTQIESTKELGRLGLERIQNEIEGEKQLARLRQANLDLGRAEADKTIGGLDDRKNTLEAELSLMREQGVSDDVIAAKELQILAITKQILAVRFGLAQSSVTEAQNKVIEAGAALARLNAEAQLQRQQSQTGQISKETQDALNDAQEEYIRSQEELSRKEKDLASLKNQSVVDEIKAREKILQLQKEAAANALLSVSDVRGFFDNFITGIQQGNQKLGKIFTDFAQATSAKFFKQLLVGKNDNFDAPILENVNELFGLGNGGLVGQIFGQGGSGAFQQFFGGFQGQGGLSNLFDSLGGGSLQNVFDFFGLGKQSFNSFSGGFSASQVDWQPIDPANSALGGLTQQQAATNAGKGFGTNMGAGIMQGIGIGIAGAQIGQSFSNGQYGAGSGGVVGGVIGAYFGGPQGAAIGAQIGQQFGAIFDSIFNKPERIEKEKKKVEKFFDKVFEDINFKILKEKDVAAGLESFDELSKAALALGAVYARSLGSKATEGTITRFGGQFLGNLLKAGVASEEAKKKLQELAQAIEADLGSAIDSINGLTQQFSKNQKNNLLSIDEFEENLEEARRNLKKYGDTANLTAKELTELALANGNTGSSLVTYGDLIAGAIDINTGFADSAIVAAQVNKLLADRFIEVVTAQGDFNEQTRSLSEEVKKGNLSLEEAIIAYNDLRESIGKAGLELKDFTLDPEKVEKIAKIISTLTQTFDELKNSLGQGLGSALADDLDPAEFSQKFDELFNSTLKNSIITAIVLGFTEGTQVETLKPLFDEINALLVEVATGGLELVDFSGKLNDALERNKEAIDKVKEAWIAAGIAGKEVLRQFNIDSANTQGLAGALASALESGLNEGLDPSKYRDKFNELFSEILRKAIVSAIVQGFLEGLALETLKPFFDRFRELLKGLSENTLSLGDFKSQMQDILESAAPEFAKLREAFVVISQLTSEILQTLGLWPVELSEVEDKLKDIDQQLDDIAQRKIDIQVTLHRRLADIGIPGEDLKAIDIEQEFAQKQLEDLLKRPFIQGDELPNPQDEKAVLKFTVDINKAMDTIRRLGDLEVERFNILEAQINEEYEREVEQIKKRGEAEEKAIRANFEAQIRASKQRQEALQDEKEAIQEAFKERMDALKEELQLVEAFAQVGERIHDQIVNLLGSQQAPVAPPGQLAFLQREAASLRTQLDAAEPKDQPALIERLSDVLEKQLSLGVFQRPSQDYRRQFFDIIDELEKLRDLSLEGRRTVEEIQEEMLALEEEQEASLKRIEAAIEYEQDLQQDLADQQQAALEAHGAGIESAIDAARASADAKIDALREVTRARLEELAAQEAALAERAEGFLLTERDILIQQLGVLRSIDNKIGEFLGKANDPNAGTNNVTNNPNYQNVPNVSGNATAPYDPNIPSTAQNTNPTNPFVTEGDRILTGTGATHPTETGNNFPQGNAPVTAFPTLTPYPKGWDPDNQPGLKWMDRMWKEVQKGADITWDSVSNTFFWHGVALAKWQLDDLRKNGPTSTNIPTASVTTVDSAALFHAPPGTEIPDPPPPDVLTGNISAGNNSYGNDFSSNFVPEWDRGPDGNPWGYSYAANGFRGLVTKPHMFMVAEKEPEFVDIGAHMRGGRGESSIAFNPQFNVQVAVTGQTDPESAGKKIGAAAASEWKREMAIWARSPEGQKAIRDIAREEARRAT